ncbi:hypothetical protein GCM10010377_55540 [Streptomyces viridiviolaceus]|nr:hypothetical protein GCM10010377_55540 [Streptomyces viridiviolaceus]
MRVDGADQAAADTTFAHGAPQAAGLAYGTACTDGDAEQLPNGPFGAVGAIAASPTSRLAAESVHVLRPGGRLGPSCSTRTELSPLSAWWYCRAIRPRDG